MKILNLYAGIGGNRKLWGDEHEVTAVEFREDIAAVYKHHFPNDTVVVGDAHQFLLDHYKKYDFVWSSPPCQTHSKARMWGFKNSDKVETKYPDMKLYQEIIFLKHYYGGGYCVENVNPFYEPLIPPTAALGRHLFWANFHIYKIEIKEADINGGNRKEWSELHGFDLSRHKINSRKDQIYRNCVHPETGLHILNCALKKYDYKKQKQAQLF
jgi:DNA (cytosine-5)-methyltransferase 1